MKTIVIHIGPPKTATSALQFCFSQNAEHLLENDIWYPQHRVDSNLVSSGNMGCILSRHTDYSNEPSLRQWKVDEHKAKKLLAELNNKSCSTLLLSSEFFWTEAIELFRVFPTAKFVAYLRNPIELLESNYNQGIKRHGKTKKLSVRRDVKFASLLTLSKLYKNIGRNNFELRPYCDDLYVGGRIETDFFSCLKVDCQTLNTERINRSYSFEALEFKRMANHFNLGKLEPKLDRVLQGCTLGNMNYSFIGPEKHQKLLARYLRRLDSLIEKNSLNELRAYRKYIESSGQKEFVRQNIDESSLQMISDYLRVSAPLIYSDLRSIVRGNLQVDLPAKGFYNCFNKSPANPISKIARRVKERISKRKANDS